MHRVHLEETNPLPFIVIQCDARYHGYSIKSVHHTAVKCGGTVTVHTRDE